MEENSRQFGGEKSQEKNIEGTYKVQYKYATIRVLLTVFFQNRRALLDVKKNSPTIILVRDLLSGVRSRRHRINLKKMKNRTKI